MEKPTLINLPKILDPRGNLTFVEGQNHIPFDIKRVYWVYDVPGGETRGGHAFKEQDEFIICLSGSFDVIIDTGEEIVKHSLNRSYYGVYIPAGVWRHVENFSTTAVENSVETVEKPITKQVLHTFHRVFNRWKSGASSTLCINSAVSTRWKRHLHFWRILPGKLVKLPPHAPKSCKKR